MIASRRSAWNYSLQRAVEWCRELRPPLLVLEALRVSYEWASDRLHRFVIDGMYDNRARFERRGCTYLAYLEPIPGQGRGLLHALARDACAVITDDYPCFFLPRMIQAAGERLAVYVEAVDGNGVIPLGLADRTYLRAHDFRRFGHRHLARLIADPPVRNPLDALPQLRAPDVSPAVRRRWPFAELHGGR